MNTKKCILALVVSLLIIHPRPTAAQSSAGGPLLHLTGGLEWASLSGDAGYINLNTDTPSWYTYPLAMSMYYPVNGFTYAGGGLYYSTDAEYVGSATAPSTSLYYTNPGTGWICYGSPSGFNGAFSDSGATFPDSGTVYGPGIGALAYDRDTGLLWAATSRSTNYLVAYDLKTHAIVKTLVLPFSTYWNGTLAIAHPSDLNGKKVFLTSTGPVGPNGAWAVPPSTLYAIDPESGQVIKTYSLPMNVSNVAEDPISGDLVAGYWTNAGTNNVTTGIVNFGPAPYDAIVGTFLGDSTTIGYYVEFFAISAITFPYDLPIHYNPVLVGGGGGSQGNSSCQAYGINDNDQVVGQYSDGDILHAFVWTPDNTSATYGDFTDLATTVSLGDESFARSINNSDQIAGDETLGSSEFGFLLDDSGPTVTLFGIEPLGGSSSSGCAINNNDIVVGSVQNATEEYRAITCDGSSLETQNLGTLPGGTYSFARGINDNGVIVGEADTAVASNYTASGEIHAFRSVGDSKTDLGSLPGGHYSSAAAVNSNGLVVGESDSANGVVAFATSGSLYTDTRANLGCLSNSFEPYSAAYAVNNAGVIVGTSLTDVGYRAVYFVQGGRPVDLNSLLPANSGWVLEEATGINSNGAITGNGTLNGYPTAFMWDPQLGIYPVLPPESTPSVQAHVHIQPRATLLSNRRPSFDGKRSRLYAIANIHSRGTN